MRRFQYLSLSMAADEIANGMGRRVSRAQLRNIQCIERRKRSRWQPASLSGDHPCGKFREWHVSITRDNTKIDIAREELEKDLQLRARNRGTWACILGGVRSMCRGVRRGLTIAPQRRQSWSGAGAGGALRRPDETRTHSDGVSSYNGTCRTA